MSAEKRAELWTNNSWFLHHDNAPAYASLLIRDFLAKTKLTVLPQPPYSPDLAPSDFFLFPKLKYTLKGQRFQTIQEIKENSQTEPRAIPKKAYQDFPEVATALGAEHQCRSGVF
jgi:transposase